VGTDGLAVYVMAASFPSLLVAEEATQESYAIGTRITPKSSLGSALKYPSVSTVDAPPFQARSSYLSLMRLISVAVKGRTLAVFDRRRDPFAKRSCDMEAPRRPQGPLQAAIDFSNAKCLASSYYRYSTRIVTSPSDNLLQFLLN
jgi:hypothetical protein